MGNDPTADEDFEILNGDFADGSVWTFGQNWAFVPNVAEFIQTPAMSANLSQAIGLPVPGNSYLFTFDILNYTGTPAGHGVQIVYAGTTSPKFSSNGTKTFEILGTQPQSNVFFAATNFANGEGFQLDNISVIVQGDHIIEELGFGIPSPAITKTDDDPAVGADRLHQIHNQDGQTQIMILYDFP